MSLHSKATTEEPPSAYLQFGLHAGLIKGVTPGESEAQPLEASEADSVAFRYMYDSWSGYNIPGNARMVAGYPWWTQAMWNRFQANQYGDGVLVVQNYTE